MMVDKTKSIKEFSDEELYTLNNRLRGEVQAQQLIRELRTNATKTSDLPYLERDVSTESPIESLYHYGIKGMKWGVRTRSSSMSSSTKSSKGTTRKKISDMSDEDLRKKLNRIQMERKYKELTKKQKSKGRQTVEQILANSAKSTAQTYVTKMMSTGADKLVKSALKSKK